MALAQRWKLLLGGGIVALAAIPTFLNQGTVYAVKPDKLPDDIKSVSIGIIYFLTQRTQRFTQRGTEVL